MNGQPRSACDRVVCRVLVLTCVLALGSLTSTAAFAASSGGRPTVKQTAPARRRRPAPRPARKRRRTAPSRVAPTVTGSAPGAPPTGTPVEVVLTTPDMRHTLSPMHDEYLTAGGAGSAQTMHVSDAIRYQTMLGFGAAMTDTSAWLLGTQLPVAARNEVMNRLFSPSGLHLNFVRVPMGASDFSANAAPYSYDDLPGGETDPALTGFSIAHDQADILPLLRQMLALDPATELISTEWSAPPWMKANQDAGNIGGAGVLEPQFYPTLAQYFVKFLQAYQAAGVPVDAITPQNEPTSEPNYPSGEWTPAQESQFVADDLEPALRQAGLHTLIYAQDDISVPFAEALEQSPAASDYAGMAWHCYGGDQTMSEFHAAYPAVPELMTECSPGIIPYGAAEASISAVRNWASSVDLWNLALDPQGGPVEPPNVGCGGCTGLVTVDEATQTVRYRLDYYELGQLSKFVQRGAVRIDSERWVTEYEGQPNPHPWGVTPGLDDVAFENPDGSKVLVAYNNTDHRDHFGVAWHGTSFNYTLAGGATVTFVWR